MIKLQVRLEGIQQAFGKSPEFTLYTILEGIPGHPQFSTLSNLTLEAKGYEVELVDTLTERSSKE